MQTPASQPSSAPPSPATQPPLDNAMTPREKRGMAAIMIAVALATLDTAIANTALPAIAADLRSTPQASVWIINAYQLAMVATLLPFAALSGIVGHRRMYLSGVIVFVISSVICAMAWSLPSLAAARALQGIGAAAIMSVNTALISAIFPMHRLGRGLGLNALIVGVSFAVGPTVASVILSFGTWPWLFAVNLPIGLLALSIGWRSLPESKRSTHGFDPVAAVLNVITFAALIFALGEGVQREPVEYVVAAAVVFLIAFVLLLRRERGHPAPMLPVDLFRRPMFALSTLTAVCSFAAQGLAFVSLPFYFEHVLGRNPVETGFLLTPWSAVVALMAPLARAPVRPLSARPARRGGAGRDGGRHGVAGDDAGGRQRAEHRHPHGDLRGGLRFLPVAQPQGTDGQRAARALGRCQRGDCHGAPDRSGHGRCAGGAVVQHCRRAWPDPGAVARRRLCRAGGHRQRPAAGDAAKCGQRGQRRHAGRRQIIRK